MLEILRGGGYNCFIKNAENKNVCAFCIPCVQILLGTNTGSFYYFHKEDTKV